MAFVDTSGSWLHIVATTRCNCYVGEEGQDGHLVSFAANSADRVISRSDVHMLVVATQSIDVCLVASPCVLLRG